MNHQNTKILIEKKREVVYFIESIFEGEFFNGKKIGKGKKYDDKNKLLFEGEYINGELIKGKKYYDNGVLKFEGEYKNERKFGKGKEYYKNGVLKFEGEYINGKKWNGIGYDTKDNKVYELKGGKGFVKKYDDYGNLIFEGEYLDGKRLDKNWYHFTRYGTVITMDYFN